MLVPHYWAEARLQKRSRQKQITLRRFGWSDLSQEDAQLHAERRVNEALALIESQPDLPRREPRRPYNGADGVPIREEAVLRLGDCVVTRNAYGARCLNTPNVLFADVDHDPDPSCLAQLAVAFFSLATTLLVGLSLINARWQIGLVLLAGLMATFVASYLLHAIYHWRIEWLGGPEQVAIDKIKRFVSRKVDWYVRVYRTPAGLRVLALHRSFSPQDPEVLEFFQGIGTDRIYQAMCRKQNCFRARVSAKPWRIGIQSRLRPTGGGWPVAPDLLPAREAWVQEYERSAAGYAACHFLEEFGSGRIDHEVRLVQRLHDELSQATTSRPLA